MRRLAFALVTCLGVMVPVAVATVGFLYSDASPSLDLPGLGVSRIDPIEASLWFCALWIAVARQLRRRAMVTSALPSLVRCRSGQRSDSHGPRGPVTPVSTSPE